MYIIIHNNIIVLHVNHSTIKKNNTLLTYLRYLLNKMSDEHIKLWHKAFRVERSILHRSSVTY